MYSSSKLYVVAAAIMLLGITLFNVEVDGKLPDTTILKGPDCSGKSPSKEYNDNVRHLIDSFVKDTKNKGRIDNGDRQFNHSSPNRNPGSPYGVSTCYVDLGKWDCWTCLMAAKARLGSGCLHPVAASVTLQDCSIWFHVHT